MSVPIDWLLLTAVREEFQIAARHVSGRTQAQDGFRFRQGTLGNARTALLQMGVGYDRARRATRWALGRYSPRQVIVIGFCGGLSPELQKGDAVCADSVVTESGGRRALPMHALPGAKVGPLFSSRTLLAAAADKRRLFDAYGAIAVDMETEGVFEVCQRSDAPLRVIRAVSDAADEDVPAELFHFVGEDGEVRLRTVLSTLVGNPRLIGPLRRLARGVREASVSLDRVCRGLASTG